MSLPDKPGSSYAKFIAEKIDTEISLIVREINNAEYGKSRFFFEYYNEELSLLILRKLKSVPNIPEITHGSGTNYSRFWFIEIDYGYENPYLGKS